MKNKKQPFKSAVATTLRDASEQIIKGTTGSLVSAIDVVAATSLIGLTARFVILETFRWPEAISNSANEEKAMFALFVAEAYERGDL